MNKESTVAIRDFVILTAKLFLDGIKDGVLFAGALIGLAVDLAFRLEGRNRLFYKVMRSGEKFDRWLNLHGALENADPKTDGLFGASEAGSDTLLGQIEQAVRGGDEPRKGGVREPLDPLGGSKKKDESAAPSGEKKEGDGAP